MGSSASSKRPNDKHKNRLQSQPAVDRVSASALAALDAERKGFVDERGLVKLLKAMKYPGGLDELKKRVSQLIEADADSNRVWTMEELQSWWNRQNFTIDEASNVANAILEASMNLQASDNIKDIIVQDWERELHGPGRGGKGHKRSATISRTEGSIGLYSDAYLHKLFKNKRKELSSQKEKAQKTAQQAENDNKLATSVEEGLDPAEIRRRMGSKHRLSRRMQRRLSDLKACVGVPLGKSDRKRITRPGIYRTSSLESKPGRGRRGSVFLNNPALIVQFRNKVSMAFDRLEEMEFETENTKKNNRKDEGGSVGSDGDTRSKRGADGIVPPTSSLASRVRSTLQLRIRSQSSASSGSSLAGGGLLCMSPTLRRETEEGSKENGSSSGEGTDGNERKGEEGREGKDRNGPSSATASPSVRKALPNSESPSPAASAAFGDEKSTTQPQLLRQYTNEAKKILAELFVLEYVHMSCEKNKYKRMVNRGIITAHEYRTKSNEIGAEFQRKYGAALGEIKSELERTGQFDRSKTNIGKVPGMFDDDGGSTDSDEDDDDECPASPGPIFRARSRQRREGISEEPHNEPLGMFRVDDNKTRRDTYTLSMKYSTVDDNGGFLDQ